MAAWFWGRCGSDWAQGTASRVQGNGGKHGTGLFMSVASYPNIEKLARLIDWALGVVFSLIKLLFWLVVAIIIALMVTQLTDPVA